MGELSRRNFLRTAASTAVAIHVFPLHDALAEFQSALQHQPPHWIRDGTIRFRQDGILKVTGNKVFAIDIPALEMRRWPDTQSHAQLSCTDRVDRRFDRVNVALLPDGLRQRWGGHEQALSVEAVTDISR